MAGKVTFVITLLGAMTNAIVNPRGPTVISDYTSCIQNIIEKNFIDAGVLIFTNQNNSSSSVGKIKAELLTRIHEKAKYTVEIKSPQKEVAICDTYNENLGVLHRDIYEARQLGAYYIIVIDSYRDFPYLVNRLVRSRTWNPSAKFIILFFNFSSDKSNKQFVEGILSCFFKYNVINISVIVPKQNTIRNAIIYAWRPFEPPKYCGYYNETPRNRLFIQNYCEKGELTYEKSIFEDKIPRNMKGCVLYIIALERQPFVSTDENNANIEMVLIDKVAERYNMTTSYKITNENRGERAHDGQWNGALKDLAMKNGQLLLGGIYPDNDVHEDYECSTSYLADSYTWVVPRAHQSPPWRALFIIFSKLVWYSVKVGFITCGLFWRVLGQISGDTPRNRSFKHCFINAWICSIGFVAYMRPTKPSLRLFFVFFNIYCIMIVTGYQTKLIDVLKNPSFNYQVKTVEELIQSGLKFGGSEELRDLFKNSSDLLNIYVYDNWIDVDDMSQAMIDVTVHRNFSLLCSRLELSHVSAIVSELSDSFGNFKYYAFEMNVFTVPLEMVALRGFGYMGRISEGLSLFKQAGINEAVKQGFKSFNALRRATLLRTLLRKKVDVNSLSLQHLQGGFVILTFGYVAGLLVFVLEILCNIDFIQRIFNKRT